MTFRALAASAALASALQAAPVLYVNQVAYDARGPKSVVLQVDAPLAAGATAALIDEASAVQSAATLGAAETNAEWAAGKTFYRADFSAFAKPGTYRVRVNVGGTTVTSEPFRIDENALAKAVVPSIIQYYFKQRATSSQEWAADAGVLLNDNSKRVDMRGGWCDASGDVSKYLSHLAYSNFVNPQQTGMVAWELTDAAERIAGFLEAEGQKTAMQNEALWGADYLYRALAAEGYFHMVVFSFFNPNAGARRVVGLLADSKTDNKWQATFRAGGGMAIAALARISAWKKNGTYFSSQNYLDGAKKAYAHLVANNVKYLYDGKENVIDDMCALMAATELWIATDDPAYRDDARKRMQNLAGRVTADGYFRANDGNRPFYHAADAGLPVVALVRYLDKESDAANRAAALAAIRKNLDWQLRITYKVGNPFGYARQAIQHNGAPRESFFIPQANETGWWWQGENARLGSLAAAAIQGGRLVYPADNAWGVKDSLARFAADQLSWILGQNPYSVSFMHGFGKNNPPLISALFGHGTGKGGIANGVTARKGAADGSGIEYRTDDGGNEWRWIEQWIPHSGWFLTAAASMVQAPAPTALAGRSFAGRKGSVAYQRGNTLELRLARAVERPMRAVLYGLDGRASASWELAPGIRSAALPLPSPRPGVYVLRVGGESFTLPIP